MKDYALISMFPHLFPILLKFERVISAARVRTYVRTVKPLDHQGTK